MNTKTLEYILAIAEEGSVSRAAERFYLTQSSMSIHLKNVEQAFGAPLFVRRGGRMELTKAGVLFANNARILLHLQKELEDDLNTLRQKQQKTFHVMVDPHYYNFFVQRVFPAFSQSFPEARMELNAGNYVQAVNALHEGRLDLAVSTATTRQESGLDASILMESSLILVFPPNYSGHASTEGLQQALDAGLLPMLHPIGTTMRMIEEELLAQAGIAPPVVYEIASFHSAMSMVQSMSSFAYVPSGLYAGYRHYGLVASPPQCPCNTLLLSDPALAAHRPGQALLKLIQDQFGAFQERSVGMKG